MENKLKQITTILQNIYPKASIYIFEHKRETDGDIPEIHLAVDVGHIIGKKDIESSQKALNEQIFDLSIYLYDLNGVSETERLNIIKKAQTLKMN